jgi:TfoX/Sxy family transcriptional regulator of competence genes
MSPTRSPSPLRGGPGRGSRQTTSAMKPGAMPKPSEQAKTAFKALVPKHSAITLKPMFGNLASFVNGNMFAGLFGEDLFVRLPDDEREKVKKQGGHDFEPIPGRAMKGYVCVRASWQRTPTEARVWISRALTWSRMLPVKKAAKPVS